MNILQYDDRVMQGLEKSNSGPGSALAFEGSTGYLLSRAGSLARRSWTRMLADRDLTPHHYGVLMALNEAGPTGQQRLSSLIKVDPRNLVPIIDGLGDRDLVTRQLDPTDRRRRVLILTEAGQTLVDDLTRSGAHMEQHFLRALKPAEQTALHRMLLAILATAAEEVSE
jgi:DNA-binding MarR family transcriptional regulator